MGLKALCVAATAAAMLIFTGPLAADVHGTKLVFRDAGNKSQVGVLATAALYARTAEAISSKCATVENIVKALGSIHLAGRVHGRIISVAKYIISYWDEVLGVDSACDTARKLSWAAIALNNMKPYMFPSCIPQSTNLLCYYKIWLETTIHRQDRTWSPDICHWKLAGSMTSSSPITVRYLTGRRGC